MKLKINITNEVLRRSFMCKGPISKSCAIAVAVIDLFPNACIGYPTISFDGIDNYHDILPDEALKFISKFDSLANTPEKRLLIPEFSFEIEVPEEVINQIGIDQVYKILSESKTLEHVN